MPRLVLATRGSQLALAQAGRVAAALCGFEPGLTVELKVIKTTGDKILDVPLAKIGGKGLFVKEIEDTLLSGGADFAVHSMKDMPSELPAGLVVAAVSEREDPRDVLVSPQGLSLDQLLAGGVVGTSSLRRKAQLLARRPDLKTVDLRGNVDTRLRKMDDQSLAGVILAAAGLNRLGINDVPRQLIPETVMLPAVGQGALGLEARADDDAVLERLARLNHPDTAAAAVTERAFLARLEGGCQVPIAGHARVEKGIVVFKGLVASLDGQTVARGEGLSSPEEAAVMGRQVAEDVLGRGGREILAQVYGETSA
jgi:hydroxymethylbilane synthase